MTVAELAQRLNVSGPYVCKFLSAGTLRAIKSTDGRLGVDRAEAEVYCDQRRA
ncbi:excisionase family DNA-binding protein [Paraburkholderia sp. RCC_158]|uniref:excisionase family DNA-binding protein n=1 Tax=Paraburkholderia sp. RCC_158 TaxID=3239220 RepID=UPI003524F4E0